MLKNKAKNKIKSVSGVLGTGILGLFFVFGSLLAPSKVSADPVTLESSGETRPPGQRRVIYQTGMNRFWIFYQNATGDFVYRSATFDSFSANATSVFPGSK